jgi:hypothetical protein
VNVDVDCLTVGFSLSWSFSDLQSKGLRACFVTQSQHRSPASCRSTVGMSVHPGNNLSASITLGILESLSYRPHHDDPGCHLCEVFGAARLRCAFGLRVFFFSFLFFLFRLPGAPGRHVGACFPPPCYALWCRVCPQRLPSLRRGGPLGVAWAVLAKRML